MKIKEVCERTGLTDRAIRLYMDNGLVTPKEELNYRGRRAISFSEEDVMALENVATLRRANFSISDIVKMKDSPRCIPEIVEQHKKTMAQDIENKKNILSTLERCDCDQLTDYGEIANVIRVSASRNSLPKEDSGMNLKDVKQILKCRFPSVIALVLLVINLIYTVPIAFKAMFAEVNILAGGGYELHYEFSLSRLGDHIVLVLALSMMLFAAIILLIYLAGGKKWWLLIGGVLCLLSIVCLFVIPGSNEQHMYFYEFLNYRNIFKYTMFYSTSGTADVLVKSVKFVFVALSGALCAVGFFTEKSIEKQE